DRRADDQRQQQDQPELRVGALGELVGLAQLTEALLLLLLRLRGLLGLRHRGAVFLSYDGHSSLSRPITRHPPSPAGSCPQSTPGPPRWSGVPTRLWTWTRSGSARAERSGGSG